MLTEVNLQEPAADATKKALELTPNLPLAHLMLGEYYLFKSDTDNALKQFELEQAINPGNFAVYDRLGDVYTRLGKYELAQGALAKAISLETSSTGPFIQMGKVLLLRNDPQTALLYLQHAEKMDPGNYITHTLLAQAYRRLGRDEDAKREIDTAAKIHVASESAPRQQQ
jgi:predicted Zn-dependent protease